MGYCPAYKGDKDFQTYWQKYIKALADSKAATTCNPTSSGIGPKDSGCKALMDELNDPKFYETERENIW